MITENAFKRKEQLNEGTYTEEDHSYPNFAIMKRNNFFSSFTAGIMYLLFLGLASSCVSITFLIVSLFDVKTKLSSSVKLQMELLAKSGVEFAPEETLHNEKTTG